MRRSRDQAAALRKVGGERREVAPKKVAAHRHTVLAGGVDLAFLGPALDEYLAGVARPPPRFNTTTGDNVAEDLEQCVDATRHADVDGLLALVRRRTSVGRGSAGWTARKRCARLNAPTPVIAVSVSCILNCNQ